MKNGIVFNGKVYANVAQALLNNGMDPNAIRTNDTLRKEEWMQFDEAIIKVAEDRLTGVADLMSRGLVYNVANGLGTTVLEYEDMSDMEAAQVSMDAVTRGDGDRVEFDINYLPLPITHKDFQINIRVLEASRKLGNPLDTTMAELAARKVSEMNEQYLFQGASAYAFGGGTIRGYVDAPNRNTVTLAQNWDASGKTGEEILQDVRDMKQASINANHFGPWLLYIPTAYETVLDDDFKANSDKTIRQRILEIAGIDDVKVSDYLTANNVLLVQMTSDVVRMVQGLPLTTVEWQTQGNMVFHFKVMNILVPQVRWDQTLQSGITHLS